MRTRSTQRPWLRAWRFIAAAGCLAAGSAGATMIDSFDRTLQVAALDAAGPLVTGIEAGTVSPGTALGNYRALALSSHSGGPGTVYLSAGTGVLHLDAPVDAGAIGTVIWSGGTTAGSSLGGVDLTDRGTSNAFRFEVLFVESTMSRAVDLHLAVTDTSGTTATVTGTARVRGPLDLLFGALNGGADLAAVARIELTVVAGRAADARLGSVATVGIATATSPVPLPPALALLAVPLLMLSRRCR